MFADPCPVLPGRQQAWALRGMVGLLLDPPGPACLSPFGPRRARPFSWRGEHGFGHRMPPICRHLMGGLTKGHPEFVFVDTIKDHLFLMCGFFSLTWGGVGLPPAKGFQALGLQNCHPTLSDHPFVL